MPPWTGSGGPRKVQCSLPQTPSTLSTNLCLDNFPQKRTYGKILERKRRKNWESHQVSRSNRQILKANPIHSTDQQHRNNIDPDEKFPRTALLKSISKA